MNFDWCPQAQVSDRFLCLKNRSVAIANHLSRMQGLYTPRVSLACRRTLVSVEAPQKKYSNGFRTSASPLVHVHDRVANAVL